jgi:hypothetical protein
LALGPDHFPDIFWISIARRVEARFLSRGRGVTGGELAPRMAS